MNLCMSSVVDNSYVCCGQLSMNLCMSSAVDNSYVGFTAVNLD